MVSQHNGVAGTPDQYLGELTPREQEVAALLAQGLTNEQIAQRLTLTRGTVANHVARILFKPGARSRVQFAAPLARSSAGRSSTEVLALLTRLQVLGPTDLRTALQHATDVLASFFAADICDAYMSTPAGDLLVALASSQTLLGVRENVLGLHRLPLSHGGRVAWVFQEQRPFREGRLEEDAYELVAIRLDLGVRSTLAAPLAVSAERRGVIVVRSIVPDHFTQSDLELLQFVAYWVALVVQQKTSSTDGRPA